MALGKAHRTDLRHRAGRPDGVIYRQQYVRCGKASCKKCPPAGPGHGPYWYGFYWDYQQRTRSFYVGKQLPAGTELVGGPLAPEGSADASTPDQAPQEADAVP